MGTEPGRIAILGAGSIGCFVGGALLDAGADLVFIGRARMGDKLAQGGLHLTDWRGRSSHIEPARIPYALDPSPLADAALVLVCVKSADTEEAALAIARYARADALVISLQNGIGNDAVLRQHLKQTVLAGMVPFNVLQTADGRFHRGTEGELMVQASDRLQSWLPLFARAHLPLQQSTDFAAVQWGKLLMNLNNGLNALSGLPLKTQLSQRAWRLSLALLMDEALSLLASAQIRPAKLGRIAPQMLPRLLRLPDFLFRRVAGASLRIDPEARSSTWEDLQAGRRTEIDYLNGAVVKLARGQGRTAPANARLVELVHQAESGKGTRYEGQQLLRLLAGQG